MNGTSYEKCSCDFYQAFCDVYGADYPDDAKTIGYCAIATCCEKVMGDDVGMGLCLTTAESSSPSGMPSGPTVSPAPSSGEPTFYPTKMEAVEEDAPSIIEVSYRFTTILMIVMFACMHSLIDGLMEFQNIARNCQ